MIRSMTPLIGILDDCDRPEAGMLVLVWGSPMGPNVEYIRASARALNTKLDHFPRLFNEIREFGASACLANAGLVVTHRGDGRARYPDGEPRYWQGRRDATIAIRMSLAVPLLWAVQAIEAPEAVAA